MADKVRVDSEGVHIKTGFKYKCYPFDRISRAFIRIHEVDGKLCCGSTVFQYFRLVLVDENGKEFADAVSENEKEFDEVLEEIRAVAPQIAIGVEKEN